MCSPATCRVCGKTTWSGCGRHVDQVMRHVPASRRCQGHDQGSRTDDAGRSLMDRLLGR